MWCANQVMIRQALSYFADEPPVIVDWAPWHHTAGGNHDVGLVLYNGGTFYIDEGKPLPGAIEETVKNLREIAPTWYFTVPKGYEALLPYLRNDDDLRRNFFSRLKLFWFAGAGIAQHVFDEIQDLAVETCGERILFLTGFGSTETAPFALARTWHAENAANMGLPGAGMELKLVPNEGKLEARVRGPNITPGYWRQPEFTEKAFDEEGFYRLGDAFKFADDERPRARACCSTAASPRTSSSRPAPGSMSAPCAPASSIISRPLCATWCWPAPDRNEIGALVFPDHRRLPQARARSAGRCAGRDRAERCARARAFRRTAEGAGQGKPRLVHAHRPRAADGGAAVARQRRDDRQGLDQPARVLTHRAALVDALYARHAIAARPEHRGVA